MAVARDVFIYWCLTFLGGAVVGYAAGALGAAQSPALQGAIGFSSLLFGVVAFFIVGVLAKRHRFGHLVVVTLFVWLTNMVNIFAFGVTAVQWLFGLAVLLVLMLIGGGASYLLAPPAKEAAPDVNESGYSDTGSGVNAPGHAAAD
jgi:hypothetical protein